MTHLTEGSRAPHFEGINQHEDKVSIRDFEGKYIILYFYPKDDTPGCTKEACSLRDGINKLNQNDAVVIGVSPDSVKSHKRFAEKFELSFHLLADEDKTIVKTYGVWGEKSMYGKKYPGVFRTTFIIDSGGIIKKIIKKVKTDAHADQILEIL